jgi:WD40 repeat protein
MNKRSIGGKSSSKAHKRHVRATFDESPHPPPASLGHSSSSSVKEIHMSLDIHLIAAVILPFIPDRVTWNNVCCASKELYRAGKNLTPPWPNNTSFNFAECSNTHVKAVACSPSGSHLAFGTNQGVVHVRDRWGNETRLDGNKRYISCLEYSSDGTYLAAGILRGESIRLWHTELFHYTSSRTSRETPTTIRLDQADNILLGNHSLVAVLAFSRTDSNLLASGGWNGEIKLWNVKEQACIHSFYTGQGNFIPSLFFAGGDRSVCNAVLSTGSMIRLWRAEGSSEFTSETIDIPGAGRLGQVLLDQQDARGGVCPGVVRPAFSPCGSFLMIAYSSRLREKSWTRMDCYELETMIKSQSVAIPGLDCLCSGVSLDSKQLVLYDANGRFRLLQTDDFSIQRYLNTRRGPPFRKETVRCIAFDPTCRVLAIGSHDGRFQLRNIIY